MPEKKTPVVVVVSRSEDQGAGPGCRKLIPRTLAYIDRLRTGNGLSTLKKNADDETGTGSWKIDSHMNRYNFADKFCLVPMREGMQVHTFLSGSDCVDLSIPRKIQCATIGAIPTIFLTSCLCLKRYAGIANRPTRRPLLQSLHRDRKGGLFYSTNRRKSWVFLIW